MTMATLITKHSSLKVVANAWIIFGKTKQTWLKSCLEYMASMNEYLDCVNDELTAAGDDASAEYKAIMLSRHNAAVAEMETVAEDFNLEVQAYREANPEEG